MPQQQQTLVSLHFFQIYARKETDAGGIRRQRNAGKILAIPEILSDFARKKVGANGTHWSISVVNDLVQH
jgi:hypothetical protein